MFGFLYTNEPRGQLMRKFLFSLVLSTLFLAGNGWSATYYVDQTGGNDANNGLSTGSAWKTIAKVNASYFAPGDSILFKRGEIWREQLTVPSSGSAGSPITFGAFGSGAKPIIQPTTALSSWTQESGNIYYATLATAPTVVSIGSTFVQPAHWPTTVGDDPPVFQYPSSNSGNATTLIDIDLPDIAGANLVGTQVNIYTTGFSQANSIVSAYNGTNTLTMASAGTNPTTSMKYYLSAPSGAGRAYSTKSWMMSENTWFYDADAKRLYVWKTGGGNTGTVDYSVADSKGIYALNRSNITIDGLNLRFADWANILFDASSGNVTGLTVTNCDVSYGQWMGIYYLGTASYSAGGSITNNNVHHNRYSSIRKAYGGDVLIQNNTIAYSNWYPTLPGGYGITAQTVMISGAGATVNSNTVSFSINTGISIYGNNAVVTNNKVDHTSTILNDSGGIYTDASSGHLISGNILTGGTGFGIYLDEQTDNSTIENNSVTGPNSFGIFLHFSDGNIIRHNTIKGPFTYGDTNVAAGIAIRNNAADSNDIYYNIVNCTDTNTSGIYLDYAANMATNIYNNTVANCKAGLYVSNYNNVVANAKNNIFYNNTTHVHATTGGIQAMNYNFYYPDTGTRFYWNTAYNFANWKTNSSLDANSPTPADPLFVSVSDFHLQSGSPAINAGINVNLTSDSLGNPVPFGSSPDMGAYEYTSLYSYPNIPAAPAIIGISP